jgi:hypothetical protein
MKPKKPWTEMTTAELREATSDLNGTVLDKTRPLNEKERKLWEQAKRGGARPKTGTGSRKISISLAGDLLRQADVLAKERGVKRSELIAGLVAAGLRGNAL